MPLSTLSSTTDHIDSVVADLCRDLQANSSEPAEIRAQAALRRVTAELAFDTGVILRGEGNREDHGRIQLSTGAPFDAAVMEVLTWPCVDRVVRRTGLLALGVPSGESAVPPDDRRRLWAMGVGSLVCVPLVGRDLQDGALVFCSRHSLRFWPSAAGPALISAADALRQTLNESGSPLMTNTVVTADQSQSPLGRRVATRQRLGTMLAREADIVGISPAWRYVMFRVDQVATTQATVLLLGETGTGKELVARAIHQRSHRAAAKFVALNCSALPATLIESELFGHERGAFTGAHVAQPGRFELAHRGTLFLDEIGELSTELQPKILRVLQEGQFDRLGGTQTMDVDVRVIAATNRDLLDETRHGRFRQDLYYRLNVFPITLPSLRERREDIPLLASHLAERFGRALRKPVSELSDAVLERLQQHDWPGNIRELENVIQRAIIMSTNGSLSLREIQLSGTRPTSSAGALTLAAVEREHILRVLALTSWRIEGASGAAHLLGLKPSTLRSRLRKLGINRGH